MSSELWTIGRSGDKQVTLEEWLFWGEGSVKVGFGRTRFHGRLDRPCELCAKWPAAHRGSRMWCP